MIVPHPLATARRLAGLALAAALALPAGAHAQAFVQGAAPSPAEPASAPAPAPAPSPKRDLELEDRALAACLQVANPALGGRDAQWLSSPGRLTVSPGPTRHVVGPLQVTRPIGPLTVTLRCDFDDGSGQATVIDWTLLPTAAPAPAARPPTAAIVTSAPESAYDRGVEAYRAKDYATARVQWRKALDADPDNTYAMNNLGFLQSRGLGGKRDMASAVKLWTTAARRGNSESALHLGQAYQRGTGVPTSQVEAYAWIRCAIASARVGAAEEGDDDTEKQILSNANDGLAELMAEFVSDKFPQAQTLAATYVRDFARKPATKP